MRLLFFHLSSLLGKVVLTRISNTKINVFSVPLKHKRTYGDVLVNGFCPLKLRWKLILLSHYYFYCHFSSSFVSIGIETFNPFYAFVAIFYCNITYLLYG